MLGKSLPDVPTIDEIIQHCLSFEPKLAAKKNDSTLCVTPPITAIMINAQAVRLKYVEKRLGAAYVRVSSARQRTPTDEHIELQNKIDESSSKSSAGRRRRGTDDGHSEREQITRAIEWFLDKKMAFRIYSDASVSGDEPHNKPELIQQMLDRRADRYESNFTNVLF